MSAVFIIGAGGHARVVADAALEQGRHVVAIVDELNTDVIDGAEAILHIPLFGGGDAIARVTSTWPDAHALVAIGDCGIRARISNMLRTESIPQASPIIHPFAWVSRHASVQPNTVVMAGAVVQTHAELASGVIINTGARVDHDCRIGYCAHIAPGAVLAGNVRVGARSFIGAGASVIPGIEIGDDVVVGAGAVVNRHVASGTRVVGVPARPLPSP